jgi:hypothetical protein
MKMKGQQSMQIVLINICKIVMHNRIIIKAI